MKYARQTCEKGITKKKEYSQVSDQPSQTRTFLLQVLETTSSNHSDLLLKPKNLHAEKANKATPKSISQSQVCVNHSSIEGEGCVQHL